MFAGATPRQEWDQFCFVAAARCCSFTPRAPRGTECARRKHADVLRFASNARALAEHETYRQTPRCVPVHPRCTTIVSSPSHACLCVSVSAYPHALARSHTHTGLLVFHAPIDDRGGVCGAAAHSVPWQLPCSFKTCLVVAGEEASGARCALWFRVRERSRCASHGVPPSFFSYFFIFFSFFFLQITSRSSVLPAMP